MRASEQVTAQRSDSAARRSAWLRLLSQWHWISAALCLVGMLFFAVTGITLNNAAHIPAARTVIQARGQLPPSLLAQAAEPGSQAPLPPAWAQWLQHNLDIRAGRRPAEWDELEVYLSLPRPGGDAWLLIDLGSGELEYELTRRGWLSWLNDLHKGRHTGVAWSWFLDLFAVACLVFTFTGLWLLHLHGRNRPSTWPLVVLGLLSPLVLLVLFH